MDFNNIKIGDKAEFSVTLTEELHDSFRLISEDNSAIHTSRSFAASTKFGNKIGYAGFLHALLSRMYGEYLPGGTSVCIKQNASYPNPFYIGETLTVYSEVLSKSEATKFVEIKTEVKNGSGKKVFTGTGTVMAVFQKHETTPLFQHESDIYGADITEALRKSGIREGDTLFIHSDIAVFGKLKCRDRELLLDGILNSIRKAAGPEGTIVMPAFTYSFCKGEDFETEKTPSTVGILTEHFRKQPETIRSSHPIFSVAAEGSKASEMTDTDMDSFGVKSSFANLVKLDGKLVFFGASVHSITFIHHIEQMHGIPYRFMKTFSGNIIQKGQASPAEATFLVRYLDKSVVLDTALFEERLLREGKMTEVGLGAGTIKTVSARDAFETGMKMLDENIFSFLKEPV